MKPQNLVAKVKSLRIKKGHKEEREKAESGVLVHEETLTSSDGDYAKSIKSNRQSVISVNGNRLSGVPEYEKLVQFLKDELNKANTEKESVKQEADKTKEELERRNQNLINELESSNQVVEKLQKDVSAPPSQSREVPVVPEINVIQGHAQEIEQLKSEIQQLNSRLATTTKEEAIQLSKSRVELEAKEEELVKLKAELQEQKDVVQRITSELSVNKQEVEKTAKRASVEVEKTRVALEVNKHEFANLKAELEQRNTTIQQLNSDLAASRKENEKVKKDTSERKGNSTSPELEKTLAALQAKTDEVAKLKTGAEKQNSLIQQLTLENQNNLKAKEADISKLNSIIEEIQHDLTMKNEEITHLRANVEKYQVSLRENADECVYLKTMIEETRCNLESSTNDISRLRDDIKSKDQTIKELKIAAASKEEEEVEKRLTSQQLDKSAQGKLDKTMAENDSLRKELQNTKADLQQQSDELQRSTAEFQQALQTVNFEKQVVVEQQNISVRDLGNARQQMQELSSQLSTYDQKIRQQTDLLQSMVPKEQFDSINSILDAVKSELESARLTKSEHESRCNMNMTVDKDEELRSAKAELKATITAQEWERKRYESSISELKNKNEILVADAAKHSQFDAEHVKLRTQLEQKSTQVRNLEKLMKDNERLRAENEKLLASTRKAARDKTETQKQEAQTPQKSPRIKVIPMATVEEPTSNQNRAVEPTHINGIVPQANIVPETTNGATPRQMKDDGNDGGWITVKRKNVRSRNSMNGSSYSLISDRSLLLIKTTCFIILFISIGYLFNWSGVSTKFRFLLDYYKVYYNIY